MLGTATPGKKRVRSPSPEGGMPSSRQKRVKTSGEERAYCLGSPSTSIQHQETEDVSAERHRACIQDLPPEIMEVILGYLSPPDIMAFGATCTRNHLQSCGPWVWKRVFSQLPDSEPSDWQRLAVLKYTQALHTQRLGTRSLRPRPLTSRTMDLPGAHGYQRVLPARDSALLWDYQRTLHLLRHDGVAGPLSRPTVICHNVKDFAVDPRSDSSHRDHVYVLAEPEDVAQRANVVTIYSVVTGALVLRVTFHPSLSFTQIRLSGTKSHRQLLLISSNGKVYGLQLNETHLLLSYRSFSMQMTCKRMTTPRGSLSICQVHSSQYSALYLSEDGKACLEVNSPALYKKMFGGQQLFPALNMPVHLPLPTMVVKCSVGPSHICLVDETGGVFTQGENTFGQLGTGDRIDRSQLTQVAVSMRPVDVCCGLHHTLALLQEGSGAKELHGCGFGGGGRLPGRPRGSDVLVKLNVQVTRASRSICAVQNCLYIMSSHDINKPSLSLGHH